MFGKTLVWMFFKTQTGKVEHILEDDDVIEKGSKYWRHTRVEWILAKSKKKIVMETTFLFQVRAVVVTGHQKSVQPQINLSCHVWRIQLRVKECFDII